MKRSIVAVGGREPFNIRECPVWAIPQLAHLLRHIRKCRITQFIYSYGTPAIVVMEIGREVYVGHLWKCDMEAYVRYNREGLMMIPPLYAESHYMTDLPAQYGSDE